MMARRVMAASRRLWTPREITMALWLDAADSNTITKDENNLVSQWNDKSGNSRYAAQSDNALKPSYVNNWITFDSDYLTIANTKSAFNFAHTDKAHFLFVAKAGLSSNPNKLYNFFGNHDNSSSNIGIGIAFDDRSIISANNALTHSVYKGLSGNYVVSYFNGSIFNQNICNTLTPNARHIISSRTDVTNATATNRHYLSIDGAIEINYNTYSESPSQSNATYDFQIGSNGTGMAALVGEIGELVIVASMLSDTTRKKIEGYLAHKWSLTANLPADHPYKFGPPRV